MRISEQKRQLLHENEELRRRLDEAQETLRAIRAGEVDALVVSGPEGDQLYTLKGADYSYRILLETMEEGAATLAGDGTILYCNNRLAGMLEAPLHKVIGSSLQGHLSHNEAKTLQEIFREGEGISRREESYLNRADGSRIPVLLSFGSLQIADVRGLCLTVTDLTDQKRVEEELRKAHDELEKRVQKRTEDLVLTNRALHSEIAERRKAEQALRDSEARANALVKYAPTGIYEMDYRRPSFLNVNDAMCHILGYTREELFSMDPSALLDDDSRARFADRIRRQLAGQEIDETVEYRVRKKDGSLIHAILNVSLDGRGKEPYRALVVAYDITERKRMEEELRKSRDELEIRVRKRTAELSGANEELQAEIARREKAEQQLRQAQKMEAVGTLTGGIAHDLNNILAPIVINSELALSDLPAESSVRENLDLILKSGTRGKELVKQLLLFSRKTEKKQEMVILTPMIKETFKLLRASIPATVQMKLHVETESDAVYADPSQIQQVIMNLCTNAAYAMRATTGSIDISLQGVLFGSNDLPETDMEPGEYLVISVRDTGHGMDEEITGRLFEPFFTTKPPGEGTGLGLSVAYGIVKNHRGNITVYSEPGKGSIFKVYLPKAAIAAASEPEILRPIPTGKEQILFVDDEEFIARSVKKMLQRLGYQVTAVTDSREALRLFTADPSRFDLVMTDETMPFLTGVRLGTEMLRIRKDIPVILCTGHADYISTERVIQMGFRAFILKPFTVRQGAELLRLVLDQNRTKAS